MAAELPGPGDQAGVGFVGPGNPVNCLLSAAAELLMALSQAVGAQSLIDVLLRQDALAAEAVKDAGEPICQCVKQ